MKKTTSQPAKSPAPAIKPAPVAKVAKPTAAPAKPTAASAKPTVTPAKPAAKIAAKKSAPAPAVKTAATPTVATTITAQIDIGFGNMLFVRGEGPGLSWDRGMRMDCVSDNLWKLVLGESASPLVFKFLVNDLTWSSGPDFSVASGSTVKITPEF